MESIDFKVTTSVIGPVVLGYFFHPKGHGFDKKKKKKKKKSKFVTNKEMEDIWDYYSLVGLWRWACPFDSNYDLSWIFYTKGVLLW